MSKKLLIGRVRVASSSTRAIWNVVIPVALGAAIYTLWRSHHLMVFGWYDRLGISPTIVALRRAAGPWKHNMPSALLYSLPDALWVYAFTAALALIWEMQPKTTQRLLWLFVPSILAIGAEFGQAVHLVQGTFDWLDVVSYILAGTFGAFLPQMTLTRRYRNSTKEIHAIV